MTVIWGHLRLGGLWSEGDCRRRVVVWGCCLGIHVPPDPLCPESSTYPTSVANLPVHRTQGGHVLPTQPGQVLLREGTLQEMGPDGSWSRKVCQGSGNLVDVRYLGTRARAPTLHSPGGCGPPAAPWGGATPPDQVGQPPWLQPEGPVLGAHSADGCLRGHQGCDLAVSRKGDAGVLCAHSAGREQEA